jgi:sterol desaturase/sphingolipid hydroxylase (fatty acid hydroxylase superfamily)
MSLDATAFALTAGALTLVIAVRYLVISGLFYWLLWRRRPGRYVQPLHSRPPSSHGAGREIGWSLIASLIYALPAAAVIELWKQGGTALYSDTGQYGAWYLPVSVLLYLALHDTYFYWTHRLMHVSRVYRVMHRVHHQSRPPTPFASFSFHPTEAVLGAVFLPALALFIPLHVGAALFILVLMTVCAVMNHSAYEILPPSWLRGFGGRWFISAAHHDLHHAHVRCNYGLYFRVWDKLMGTDRLEADYHFMPPPIAADSPRPSPS